MASKTYVNQMTQYMRKMAFVRFVFCCQHIQDVCRRRQEQIEKMNLQSRTYVTDQSQSGYSTNIATLL
jgi:predicted metal-binding transcription factor (methanogenesis marker protein 9)